ncbi:MAG: type I DNA topoisomerase [Patescibacteria group bacterium]
MIKAEGKKLLIVESPAKAKTIGQYLGGEYRVLASVGHIRDLPKSNKNAIDIAAGFVPRYEVVKGKEHIVNELTRAAKQASSVLLATDPDREGEAIAWHIAEAIGLNNAKLKTKNLKLNRVVFHEITKAAIETALTHPRPIDDNLRHAQEARRVLDRLFGYDLSGLIWQKLRYGLSAGRVQSPALRILVEREKEIRAFIPEHYWVITALLETKNGDDITFTCSIEPKTAGEAETIVEVGREANWQVGKIEARAVARRPRPPFTTSTLQQAASSRLGLSPSMTMRHAQRLYEAGLITYMRTDSTNMNAGAVSDIIALAKKEYGENYAGTPRFYQTKSKNAQEAHEAIRPTKIQTRAAGGSDGEHKLYDLIWRRTVASQMTDAAGAETRVTALADNKTVPPFTAGGYLIKFDGWLRADPAAKGEEHELPPVSQGEALQLKKIESEGKQTTPPNRYSEAGLVKELEKRGIGRPSTYASTIKTILDRGYVDKISRSLQPTQTGEVVSDFLDTHFHNYISDSFTAKMEDELDEIAGGRLEYRKSLTDFYGPFHQAVVANKDIPKINNLGAGPAELKCPICGGDMVWKLGRGGKFLSCGRFPDCPGARSETGEAMQGPKETGEKCPDCKDGKLVERDGRFGRFIACSNYPKCKFVKPDEQVAAAADTGVKCPMCKKGTMAERRGKYGLFYGCTNYPACKNAIKAKPTGDICHLCGALMMEGTKTIPNRCSNKTCPNHNPQKVNDKKIE